ncbi:hypothetical protein E4T43_03837 [Aureobasidium subglaciale]|nr:hypothetical protein E4T43_03837 [Aureobasidium subglaciale]
MFDARGREMARDPDLEKVFDDSKRIVHIHSYISVAGSREKQSPVPCFTMTCASYEWTAPGPRSLQSLPSFVSRCLVHCHTLHRRKGAYPSPSTFCLPSTLLLVRHVWLFFVSHVLIHCTRHNAQMSTPLNEVIEKYRKVVDEVSGPGAVANKVDDRNGAPAEQEIKKGAASASNPASQHGGTSLVSQPIIDTPATTAAKKKPVKMQKKILKPAHDDGEFEDIDLGDSEQETNMDEWVWVGK